MFRILICLFFLSFRLDAGSEEQNMIENVLQEKKRIEEEFNERELDDKRREKEWEHKRQDRRRRERELEKKRQERRRIERRIEDQRRY